MLTIAVAQPPTLGHDVAANALAHAEAVRRADARLVVFPELSLTGYELDAARLDLDDPRLQPLITACEQTDTIALAGAPVNQHIAILRFAPHPTIAYRKAFLGGGEVTRFKPGDGPAAFTLDGWRIGLGICKDTRIPEHIEATAALDIDLYAAGLAYLPEEQDEHNQRARTIAAATGAHVAFASFAGPTGGGYDRTAGHSAIWSPGGTVLAGAGADPGDLARLTLEREPRAERGQRERQRAH